MDGETIRVEVSPEELRQLMQNGVITICGVQLSYQHVGPFITIEDRVKERWPMATTENRRRIRDVTRAKYCECVGRHPYKLTGHINGAFVIEEEHLGLLDRAIDLVRNEADERKANPLFTRRPR